MNSVSNRSEQIVDELLILRCQDGERAAIEILVTRWQVPLLRFARIVTGDAELARDSVQDAWVAIIRGLHGLHDPSSYRSWMFRILHNKCIDRLRAQRPAGAQASEETSRQQLKLVEDREQVMQAMGMLSEHHRVVLALHYLHDMSVVEIAASLDIPGGTVKSRLHHAREAFRGALNEGGAGDGHQQRRA